jgi:catalase-peroxidase
MYTTDMALKLDPIYGPISKRFHENPDQFQKAFAKAWFKLTHRDMGPVSRYLGPEVPESQLLWQDPVPVADYEMIGDAEIDKLKKMITDSGLSVSQLVTTAWASASTYRVTDKRGGANGARIRLAPQKDWKVNQPEKLAIVLSKLEKIQQDFNASRTDDKKVSVADLIVLGGCVGVETAAKNAGHDVSVPFSPGRTDATQDQTDVDSFSYLEPKVDGFRNYAGKTVHDRPLPEILIDRAHKLTLTAPEMTVLIGGMRVLGTNAEMPGLGEFTKQKEALTNDFFVNLLDMSTKWKKSDVCDHFFEGLDSETADIKWTATSVDLVFGSNSQLRALAEVYAAEDSKEKFVDDFVTVWTKVMNLDRFDLKAGNPEVLTSMK